MKQIKRTLKSIMVLTVIFTMLPMSIKASDIRSIAPTDFGTPIRVTTYEEEDGSVVTERIYFCLILGFAVKVGLGGTKMRRQRSGQMEVLPLTMHKDIVFGEMVK